MNWLRATLLILAAVAICQVLAACSEDSGWGANFEGAPVQPSATTTSAPGND